MNLLLQRIYQVKMLLHWGLEVTMATVQDITVSILPLIPNQPTNFFNASSAYATSGQKTSSLNILGRSMELKLKEVLQDPQFQDP